MFCRYDTSLKCTLFKRHLLQFNMRKRWLVGQCACYIMEVGGDILAFYNDNGFGEVMVNFISIIANSRHPLLYNLRIKHYFGFGS